MSRNSSRIPGASISSITAGCGPPRSGWQIKVSIAPSAVVTSSVCSIMWSSPHCRPVPVDSHLVPSIRAAMDGRLNKIFRAALLGTRWGMMPFGVGLGAALIVVLGQFLRDLVHIFLDIRGIGRAEVMVEVLKLVDLVL